MNDQNKSKKQLIEELIKTRDHLSEMGRLLQEYCEFQESLRSKEELYRELIENISDCVWEVDKQFHITYVSPRVKDIAGYTPEEILGKTPSDILKIEEMIRLMSLLDAPPSNPRALHGFEHEVHQKDGSIRILETNTLPTLNREGQFTGYRGITRDITARKKAEEALARSEAKYRYLTEKMNDVVWTMDVNFIMTYVSPSIRKTLGYSQEEVVGRKPGDIMTPESTERALTVLDQEVKRDQQIGIDPDRAVEYEAEHYHRNGSLVWFAIVASFIRDDNGKIIGLYGVARNITEQKLAAAEREKLIDDLKQALSEVKTLSGLLPICSNCKKIRDDKGYWNQLEGYISEHSEALFSHSICPDCATKLYPHIFRDNK